MRNLVRINVNLFEMRDSRGKRGTRIPQLTLINVHFNQDRSDTRYRWVYGASVQVRNSTKLVTGPYMCVCVCAIIYTRRKTKWLRINLLMSRWDCTRAIWLPIQAIKGLCIYIYICELLDTSSGAMHLPHIPEMVPRMNGGLTCRTWKL